MADKIYDSRAIYFVDIVEKKTGTVEEHMGPMNERQAERCAEGALINLNRAEYKVVTKTEKAEVPV